jgi:MFS family permease
MYTVVLVLFMLMMIYFLRAIRGSEKSWYGVAIGLVALMWFHYFMIVPLVVTVIYTALIRWKRFSKEIIYSAVILVTGLALLAIPALASLNLKFIEGYTIFFTGMGFINQILIEFSGVDVVFGMVLVGLAAIGLYFLEQKESVVGMYVFILTIVSLAITYLISFDFMIFPKYVIYLLPLLFILSGHGMICMWAWVRSATQSRLQADTFFFILILSVIVVFMSPIPAFYTAAPVYDWSDHDATMRGINQDNGTMAVLMNPGLYTQWYYYYPSRLEQNVTIVPFYNLEMLKGIAANASLLTVAVPDVEPNLPEARNISLWLNDNGKSVLHYRAQDIYEVTKP